MNTQGKWDVEQGWFFWRAVYRSKTKVIKGPRRRTAKAAWTDLFYFDNFTKH